MGIVVNQKRREEIAKFFDDHPEMSIAAIGKHFKMSKSGINIYKPKGDRTVATRHRLMMTTPPEREAAIKAFNEATGNEYLSDLSIYEGIRAVFLLKGT